MHLSALIKILAIATTALCLSLALRANDPGGGASGGQDVTLTVSGSLATLDNGIIRATINTVTARIVSYTFNGTQMADVAGTIYFSKDVPDGTDAKYQNLIDCVFSVTTNTSDMVDVSCKDVWSSGSGKTHAIDFDCHFVLRRGDTGLYVYVIASHPSDRPATTLSDFRLVWRKPYTSTDWFFERIYADDRRNGYWGTRTDFNNMAQQDIAEIYLLTTGSRTGEYHCKYEYSVEYQAAGCWGHASNINKKGSWIVLGGYDYLNDGPVLPELSVDAEYALIHFQRDHYNASDAVIAASEEWSKIYGPILLYCNETTAASNAGDELWADAKAQVQAEKNAWPYDWLSNADYPAKLQRGDVKGKIIITDPLNPTLSSGTNTWIGLSQPDTGGNWQFESKRYQAWVHPDENGDFTIPSVRPGSYTFTVFTDGAVSEYAHPQPVTVTGGGINDMGNVTWTVPHPGQQIVWEIGVPNRRIDELYHGDDYWKPYLWKDYHNEFPNPLEYTIGQSSWASDWNYAHSGYLVDGTWSTWKWRINFNLDTLPASGNATLTLAFASIDRGNVRIFVNQESSYLIEVSPIPEGGAQGGNALSRLGNHAKYSLAYVTIPLQMLRVGANTITLLQRSTGSQQPHVMYDYINLEMPASSPPLSPGRELIWRGGNNSNVFDNAVLNFADASNQTVAFTDGDSITFSNSGLNEPAITKAGTLMPSSITVDSTKNYTIGGDGFISGPTTLRKTGGSRLILNGTNNYYGGTLIEGGVIQLGSTGSSNAGIGLGPITFNSGTLQLAGHGGANGTNWGGLPNVLIVPEGKTGTLLCPPRMAGGTNTAASGIDGALAGSGSLTVAVDYLRGYFSGDWSAFSGQINVIIRPSSSTDNQFRIFNQYGYGNASINLGPKVFMLNILESNDYTIEIGALSGDATARLQGGPSSGKITTWKVGAKSLDTTYAGSIENLTGLSALTKVGDGTFTLSGVSTYTGTTTINAGTLVINGTLGATNVIVKSGATISGTGTIGGGVQVTNKATWQLSSTQGNGLTVGGAVTLSGTVIITPAAGIISGGASLATGTYNVFTTSGGINNTAEFIWDDSSSSGLSASVATVGNALKLILSQETPPTPPTVSGSHVSGMVGAAFSVTITVSASPATFTATGLPAGLAINASTGVISGTPSAAGTYHVAISATTAVGVETINIVITVDGKTALTTLAGAANAPGAANGASAAAHFDSPGGAAVDKNGNLYIADTGNNIIRKIAPNGTVSTFATGFNAPSSVVIDAAGATLYVADTGNSVVRKVELTTAAVSVLSLSGGAAQLGAPHGLAIDAPGNLYVADAGSHVIRKINTATGAATIFAGAVDAVGSTDGIGTSARFNIPMGLALDSDGKYLYVADTGNSTIRRIALASALVETIAGLSGNAGSTDGTAANARFNTPQSLVIDSTGMLYIADTGNNTIRKLDIGAGIATTLAGTAGVAGWEDGIGNQSMLTAPAGIAMDGASGEIYVLDTGNHIVRVLQIGPCITMTPASQTVTAGATVMLKTEASGAPMPAYQWHKNNSPVSTATNATLAIAPAQATDTGSYYIVATNPMGSARSDTALLTVNASGTTPPPVPDNNGGKGGGGAPSLWFALASTFFILLRCAQNHSLKS